MVEGVEYDETGPWATGLFDCHLERDDGTGEVRHLGEGTPTNLATALASARKHTARVIVHIPGEGRFSAGEEGMDEPAWNHERVLVRRRPAGWEFLERDESAAVIEWDVLVEADPFTAAWLTDPGTDASRRWHDDLGVDPTCTPIEVAERPCEPPPSPPQSGNWTASFMEVAVLRVGARTCQDAIDAATTAATDALTSVPTQRAPCFIAQWAFPTGSDLADRNAHLGRRGILW